MNPEALRRKVGKNVRDLRESAGIQQKQFSEEMSALGFKWVQQTCSNVEHGRRGLPLEESYAVSLILGCRLPELLQIDVKQPLRCDGLKPLAVPVVVAWLHGQVTIRLNWDTEARSPKGWTISPTGHDSAALSEVLDAVGWPDAASQLEQWLGISIEEADVGPRKTIFVTRLAVDEAGEDTQ
ncbi:MAG: helix-turn-helix transcriptional regulator [Actinomycetota bacterium]